MEGRGSAVKVSDDAHPMHMRSALRIAGIVSESYRLGLPDVDWFVMGNTTLFFPENHAHVVSKHNDRKLYYIEHNSEDSRQSERRPRTLAFWGGGIAISYPLAKALLEMEDECLGRYTGLYGSDERVKAPGGPALE